MDNQFIAWLIAWIVLICSILYCIRSLRGRDKKGRFIKGHTPWNKDKGKDFWSGR